MDAGLSDVGEVVGASVVGLADGEVLGPSLGLSDGAVDGYMDTDGDSVGPVVGGSDTVGFTVCGGKVIVGCTVGDMVGEEVLHLGLHCCGQKNFVCLPSAFHTGWILRQRLFVLSPTQVQSFPGWPFHK